jgi:murein L,D-transpeptidase YafK
MKILKNISFPILILLSGFLGGRHILLATETGRIKADLIVIEKANRKLFLIKNDSIIKTYTVSLGKNPVGPKRRQGDHKTPEGKYWINHKLEKSQFFRSLKISYPNESDIETARLEGAKAGSDIAIHGLSPKWSWIGPLHRFIDWTDGCIAVTNKEISEIWEMVSTGTPVEIKP